MKVLHIVRQFNPSVGGLEDSVLNLARIQRDLLGIDATVLTLDRVFGAPDRLPATDIVQGVPVRRIAWRGSTRYPLAPGVLRHLGDATIVHVHAIDFFFDFLAATRWLHGRTLVASTHGGFFHTSALRAIKTMWFRTVTRASLHAYARIVACSHSDARMFEPIAGTRLLTIENGIDQRKFRAAAAVDPTRTIVSFGRFARHKQIDLLFPLLARLRAGGGDWRLIVAGRPADQSEADLAAAARAAGVADAVRFVIAPSDDELKTLFSQASYYGCLSRHEGFGLAAVEALSAGLIPVLSDIVPFRRLVGQTGMGIIRPADDVDGLAEEMLALHARGDEALRSLRTHAIRESAHYDWNDVARRYTDMYGTVLMSAGKNPAPPISLDTAQGGSLS
ncbi:glycosyl transferase group 1 [Gluconacetobacter diazotrophicus PA1 5]|uniref:glycosyltransferase family 4 protein n=1 Tax=Gluconacetobacter diazotrophicus TaxID=33996 RepID=UPI000173AF3C|nr:glycosyltransferase family 4 protein [Gluconacetobacter diazotrophicus]ACI50579.1 glycosyl transferase group 1 [Gluconacetobacter diazotrophicus PA1 5]TWB09411.1 alpha-1,3-mannosyltransferase [Gluconacetobacter diazotrophicus]